MTKKLKKPKPLGLGLPFEEAIQTFRQKVRLPTQAWTDLWEGMHARAFVVAGAQSDALLGDFQQALMKNMEDGRTLADFRKDFDTIVARHGWSYKGERGWRSKTIYHTNMRQSMQAGRWKQIQRTKKTRPYLGYRSVLGPHTRAEHASWHNTVLPVDDPWWKTHNPMNGWGCLCVAIQLSIRDLKRYGLKVSKTAPKIELETRTINTPSGPLSVSVPKGVDPGFAYNPGEAAWGTQISENSMAAWRAQGAKAWEPLDTDTWRTLNRPERIPVDKPAARLGPKVKSTVDLQRRIEATLGGEEKIFELPDGSPLLVNAKALAEHMPLERAPMASLLPELIENPHEIWIRFERHRGTGQVQLRKRMIKAVNVGKDRVLLLVAQAVEGRFEAWTAFLTRDFSNVQRQRAGRLVYARDLDNTER